jgi:signal transduction histidine kinase
MTLRIKIFLLFVGLAIVPLVSVGAFGSSQAGELTARLVSRVLDEPARDAAEELAAEIGQVEEGLRRLGRDPGALAVGSGTRPVGPWLAAHSGLHTRIVHLELRDGSDQVLADWGRTPDQVARCAGGRHARYLRVRQPAPAIGTDAWVVAGLWLDGLQVPALARDARTPVVILHRQTGQVLLAPSCDDELIPAEAGGGIPPLFADGGGLYRNGAGGQRFAGIAAVEGRPWIAMASSPGSVVLGPLRQIQRSFWLFVLCLTLATGVAFSLLLGNVVRSLEQLTDAAARIGDGDLHAWLPPPGDDEVGRLSLAFGQMLERLRSLVQHVDQEGRLAVVGRLTAYLAHEIRNPLSSIRLNLQTLERDARRGDLPAGTAEIVQVSLREVDRLAGSVTRALQLAGGTPEGHPVEVGVHEVVEEAGALLAPRAREAGVEIRLELDAGADRVLARPGPLKGVFVNLFMNAIEAQPSGGEVVVRSRLGRLPDGGPGVAIHVRDRGHGVPPSLRERIFEPFFTTRDEGSGIGLATSQRTVRELGGDLYLADLAETSVGSEFVLELPLAALAPETVAAPRVHLPTWMRADPHSGLAARTLMPPPVRESTP